MGHHWHLFMTLPLSSGHAWVVRICSLRFPVNSSHVSCIVQGLRDAPLAACINHMLPHLSYKQYRYIARVISRCLSPYSWWLTVDSRITSHYDMDKRLECNDHKDIPELSLLLTSSFAHTRSCSLFWRKLNEKQLRIKERLIMQSLRAASPGARSIGDDKTWQVFHSTRVWCLDFAEAVLKVSMNVIPWKKRRLMTTAIGGMSFFSVSGVFHLFLAGYWCPNQLVKHLIGIRRSTWLPCSLCGMVTRILMSSKGRKQVPNFEAQHVLHLRHF